MAGMTLCPGPKEERRCSREGAPAQHSGFLFLLFLQKWMSAAISEPKPVHAAFQARGAQRDGRFVLLHGLCSSKNQRKLQVSAGLLSLCFGTVRSCPVVPCIEGCGVLQTRRIFPPPRNWFLACGVGNCDRLVCGRAT